MANNAKISYLDQRRTRAPSLAVLLNANARAVNPKVVEAISAVVPSKDLYVSRSFQECDAIASEVIARGYQTVLTGGGDGTFVGFFNALEEARLGQAVRTAGSSAQATCSAPRPRLGVLRLGTGNALAGYTGAASLRKAGVVNDIVRASSGQLRSTRKLELIEAGNTLSPFAGVGLDALVLNNYIRWKNLLSKTAFRRLGEGGPGYAFSVGLLSVPEALLRPLPKIEIINTGLPAIPVDLHGRQTGRPVPTGAVLYSGRSRMASVGTCPNYGLGFRMFPSADLQAGRMQLRVASCGVFETLWNLPAIWRGIYSSSTIHDYLVTGVHIQGDRPMPYQVGGDAMGWRDEVSLKIAPEPAELIDFSRPALLA